MAEIIGVRFKDGGKQYYFDPCGASVRKGQGVIIETSRGIEYGECVKENSVIPDEALVAPLRPVIRLATEEDKQTVEKNRDREERAFHICQQKIEEHGLDMKLVEVEYSFEGNKVLFFFTSEGRVDFRALVKDLAAIFHTRIELRQIGVRDEAKILGGLGICGKPFCCSSFLDEFQPVSIKMAKTQNLSLNPTKISGTCGRLMCCLKYEQEAYEDAVKRCPKMDSFVETPDGVGTVTGVNLLREKIKVRMDDAPDTQKCYYGCEICVVRSGKGKRPDDYVPPSPEELAKRRMQRPAKQEDEPSAKREEEAQQPPPRNRIAPGRQAAAEQPAPAAEQEKGQHRGHGHGRPGRQEQKSAPATEKPVAQPQAASADAKEKNGGKKPRNRRRWRKPKPGGEAKK